MYLGAVVVGVGEGVVEGKIKERSMYLLNIRDSRLEILSRLVERLQWVVGSGSSNV